MDNNGQLINYIVQELKRGVPEVSIRSTLLQNGWPVDPVNRAFAILQQNEPGVTGVPTQGSLPAVQQPVQQQPLTRPVEQPAQAAGNIPYARPKRSYRKPLLIVLALVVIAALGFGIYYYLNRPLSPEQRDTKRKETLSSLADELTMYYSSQGTYPTRDQINSSDFAGFDDGFEANKFRDPTWDDSNKDCATDGRPVFLDARADGCLTYRTTARNGSDCKGDTGSKCTRVVLTATLESGDPYIVTLDQNDKKEY